MEQLPEAFGPYVLLKRLGSGGMGDVHLARRRLDLESTPKPLVIKRLRTDLTGEYSFRERFQHEAEMAVRLNSPCLARVHASGEVGEELYTAMEYIPGLTLSAIMGRLALHGPPPTFGSVLSIIHDVLEGVGSLHQGKTAAGEHLAFVHRDLSPKNMMVTEGARARLIDLGLGKSRLQNWRTQTGTVLGTLGYMAPEQVRESEVDHRADLYAVGVVLYELLTLDRYLPEGPLAQVLAASAAPQFRRPSAQRADVSTALDAVVEKALAQHPSSRFQSAEEFREALIEALPVERRIEPRILHMIREHLGASELEMRMLLTQALPDEAETDPPDLEPDYSPIDYVAALSTPHPSLHEGALLSPVALNTTEESFFPTVVIDPQTPPGPRSDVTEVHHPSPPADDENGGD